MVELIEKVDNSNLENEDKKALVAIINAQHKEVFKGYFNPKIEKGLEIQQSISSSPLSGNPQDIKIWTEFYPIEVMKDGTFIVLTGNSVKPAGISVSPSDFVLFFISGSTSRFFYIKKSEFLRKLKENISEFEASMDEGYKNMVYKCNVKYFV